MGTEPRRIGVHPLGVDARASLELAHQRVGRRRGIGPRRRDHVRLGSERTRALLQLGRDDKDLVPLGKILERLQSDADPEARSREALLEPMEHREPRGRQLAGEGAHDRRHQKRRLPIRCCHTGHSLEDKDALELAKRAAFRAGRIAQARLGEPGYVRWKGLRDVVSGATMEVQDTIVSTIQKDCPGDGFLLEEGPEDEPLDVGAERLWIVDPICGSLNFAHGIPFFAISIARRVAGNLHVGVVYDPMRDEMFSASIGQPAYLNGTPITVPATAQGPEFWEQSWVGTDLPYDGPRRKDALRVFDLHAKEVLSITIMGSPALGLCYVACGRLNIYWNLDAKPWDVAGAGMILQSAGGLLTDPEGGSWIYSTGGYVAGNPSLHQWALRALKYVAQHPDPV